MNKNQQRCMPVPQAHLIYDVADTIYPRQQNQLPLHRKYTIEVLSIVISLSTGCDVI